MNILVEIGATAPRDATPMPQVKCPVTALLEEVLAEMMEDGMVLDAEIAQTEAQRRAMWERRELAAEVTFARKPAIDTDIAVPLDKVDTFLRPHGRAPARTGSRGRRSLRGASG